MSECKSTPMYECHVEQGAKMTPFAGWNMPLQYSGIVSECKAVREDMGLFDVSHMGEIEIKGRSALHFAQRVATNNVARLKSGQVQYAAILNTEAGMIDDCTIYCLSDQHYMFVVNASKIDEVFAWFLKHQKDDEDVSIENVSDSYALIALQGPKSDAFLSELMQRDLEALKYYEFGIFEFLGASIIISRTGYTGEDGFELYVPWNKGKELWDELMSQGESKGLKPIGLGARDVLRLEAGYLLSGTDFNNKTHVLEAGLSWVVKMDKGSFIGRRAVLKLKEEGVQKRVRAIQLEEKGVPRSHYEVADDEMEALGEVLSGTFSPVLQKGIGLAMLAKGSKLGQSIKVKLRNKWVGAKVIKAPFVKGSVKNQK